MIWAFAASLALTIYTVIGWPILLGIWVRLFGRPAKRHFTPRTVTVIIAVHNGERYLRAKLNSVFALDYPQHLIEVIVVSDGSTDATEDIAAEFAKVQLLRVAKGGKCRALNTAIPRATGEILFLTDVRQELDPQCLRELVSYFADPEVGAVSGLLRIRAGETHGSQDVGVYWRLETWVRDQLSQLDSMFGATGPVYALRRELAVHIPEDVLLDDMYLPLAAFFKGYRLVMAYEAIAWDYPTSRYTEFQRKVRTLAGNYQLFLYYPRLLLPFANRMWFHYMSYKFARVLMPWLMGTTLITSFWLPDPWNRLFPLSAFLFLFAAVLDRRIPQTSPIKRITSPARTFLVMMAAAVLALRVFFVDPRSLWIVTSAKKDNKL
jgi:biofilm PGA synthesis N-glycosyltransferase PgaC